MKKFIIDCNLYICDNKEFTTIKVAKTINFISPELDTFIKSKLIQKFIENETVKPSLYHWHLTGGPFLINLGWQKSSVDFFRKPQLLQMDVDEFKSNTFKYFRDVRDSILRQHNNLDLEITININHHLIYNYEKS